MLLGCKVRKALNQCMFQSRVGQTFFSKERNVLAFFCVLYKRTFRSLRSFAFFIKERGVETSGERKSVTDIERNPGDDYCVIGSLFSPC